MTLALEGVRVLDFTDSVVGPFCGLLLADCGAEVIKIESRNHLGFRRMGPWGAVGVGPIPNVPENQIDYSKFDIGLLVGPNYSQLNRDKLSISLNLTKPEGREVFKRLLKLSDVVLENFAFGVMQKWGFNYETLKAIKEDIIYASIPSFGKGPKETWTTWGMNLLTYSGFSYRWSHPTTPMENHVAAGYHGDYMAASMSATVIVGALYYRALTGKGQFVEVPQAQTTTNILGPTYLDYFVNNRVDPPIGNRNPDYAPYNSYRCRGEDSWCVITVFNEEDWTNLVKAMDNPQWAGDPKFKDMAGRLKNIEELDANIEKWTSRKTKHSVMKWLQAHGIAAGAVQNSEDIYYDLQLRERGAAVKQDLPRLGTIEMAKIPVNLSEGLRVPSRHTSVLGEHNDYVFRQLLGMKSDEIMKLEEMKVIY